MTSLVQVAARNNAHLYEKVCAAHGCETVVKESHLLCLGQPPRFYGQAVTLQPGVGEVIAREVTGGFKDSFNDIKPDIERFELLFEASWIIKRMESLGESHYEWTKVTTQAELDEWESGWAAGDVEAANHPRQFPYSLLSIGDVGFYSAWQDGEIVGGVVLNDSLAVVGCSNLWAKEGLAEFVWWDVSLVASRFHPGVTLVGYERDLDLELACKAGFEVIGPLRVWTPRLLGAKSCIIQISTLED